MANVANIKAALSFPADPDTAFIQDGRTVRDSEIARIRAWFEATYATELGGRAATANDFAAFLWRQIAGQVKQYERRIAEQAVAQPTELSE